MDSLAGTLLYAVVKWLAYTFWCWVGLQWAVRANHGDPRSVRLNGAIAAGSMRWLLGLAFGVVIFFAFATDRDHVWQQYVTIYVPVRFVEWSIVLQWVSPNLRALSLGRKFTWVASGVALSFASDLVSPQMIEQGRFCVGRCLC